MKKLNTENLPKHIAIIMDGNRRWAKGKGLPVVAGHKKVVGERVEELIEAAGELGIPYITFWAWSSENWKRPSTEVKAIMKLFRWALLNKADKMIERGAKLKVIGDWKELDKDLVSGIEKMIDKSKDNDKITVTFAINYGGRDEILRAIAKMVRTGNSEHGTSNIHTDVQSSKFEVPDKKTFSSYLDTSGMPDPDVIIRPGGEQRLSGFMLWQSEYSELIFPEVMMPDFDKEELYKALAEFQNRCRRFGGS